MATLTLENKKTAYNPITASNDDYISPAMVAKIEMAMLQIKRGDCIICRNKEESRRYLDSL